MGAIWDRAYMSTVGISQVHFHDLPLVQGDQVRWCWWLITLFLIMQGLWLAQPSSNNIWLQNKM